MPNLTIEDLRNSGRQSGFNHVSLGMVGRTPNPYYAHYSASGGKWQRGPRRATPEEAAADYCNYVNNGGHAAIASLNRAGHVQRSSAPRDEEVEAALGVLRDARAQRQGKQGYVYCIGERGSGCFVKIGYSVNPEARVGELQTGNPRKLILMGKFEGSEEDERALHQKYLRDNTVGEWFLSSRQLLKEFA